MHAIRAVSLITAVVLAVLLAACARPAPHVSPAQVQAPAVVTLADQESHTTALLQAVSAVNDSVVWVSGHRATWARTVDGGRTWVPGAMTGADSAWQFRDVHAVDANTAYLLAAGPGERSRIFKTSDAGASWQLEFANHDSAAFYDCFDFWDSTHGIVVSDAVNGHLIVLRTDDGVTWQRVGEEGMPQALPGEGSPAASGTCLLVRGDSTAFIGTESPAGGRVYHTTDRGGHWSAVTVPMVRGEASGVAALAFLDERRGLALGGRLLDANDRSDSVVAATADGGTTWTVMTRPTFSGAVYGAAAVPGLSGYYFAAGPKGLDWTTDGGRRWTNLSVANFWAVAFASRHAGWAVGPLGRIVRITVERP